jgi:nucleoside-diphosphate-sugar epimerase
LDNLAKRRAPWEPSSGNERDGIVKVFLTGGSGYIGQVVIATLIRHGHSVEALARNKRASVMLDGLGAAPVAGQLGDLDVLRTAAARVGAVIHLAQADSADAELAAATALQDGVGAGPYIHTGGTWVYGDTDGVADEAAPWNPPAVVAWRQPVESTVLGRVARAEHPVVIRPGLVYGGQNRLIDAFFATPAKTAGAVSYIGDGANHWALVHVDDVAELYVAALNARAGSDFIGVSGVNPTAKDVAAAVSRGVGLGGKTTSITLEQARATMGPIADAFALDQQLTPARAGSELGWVPHHTEPLDVLARGLRSAGRLP